MERLRVCVTGSNGFVGQNLTEILLKENNIEIIPFVGDLLVKEETDNFFQSHKDIDQVVHLVGGFFGSFEDLVKVNVIALGNLLEALVENKIGKIIFTSTGAVYGEPIEAESKETDPLSPNTLYGLSKKYAEECIEYYADNFDLEYVILRFPNVYGAGNNKGVIYNFVSNIKEKGEITVYGDGTQSRNFLHVSDACQAIKLAINYQKSDVFNISNSHKFSINDIVEILKQNYKFKVTHLPANNNLKDLLLNIDKASKLLEFKPKITELKPEI